VRALADRSLDAGVPCGRELTAFARDIVTGSAALTQSRRAVTDALGAAAMVDAAGVASNFERMVRIADATGIELGERLAGDTRAAREALGLERPAGR
jgi:hypothetical protein